MGTFRIGLHSLHSLHCFLLPRERGILIDNHYLVDTQSASSPCITKTVNLTIINCRSQVGLMHGIPRGWGGTCGGPNRRPNRRPKYACCRNQNEKSNLDQFLRVESHDDYCLSTHDDNSMCDRMCTKCVHDLEVLRQLNY